MGIYGDILIMLSQMTATRLKKLVKKLKKCLTMRTLSVIIEMFRVKRNLNLENFIV